MKPHPLPSAQWYRHRWPWLLMAGPAVVVVAGAITAWLAYSTRDGLVADDYYKQGLAVNQRLARNDAASALQLEARLRLGAERADLRLVSRAGGALPSALRLTLAHPTRAGEDRRILLSGSAGRYAAPLEALSAGRWHVTLEDEAGTWRLDGSAGIPDAPEVLIVAGRKR